MKYYVTDPILEPLIAAQQLFSDAYKEGYNEFMNAWPGYLRANEFSLSTLLSAPQKAVLSRKHRDDISINAANNHWSLIGSAIHKALESYDKGIKERRYGYDLKELNCLVHHQSDLILPDIKTYIDFKNISCASLKYPKDDWEAQLNFGAWLAQGNGRYVNNGKLSASHEIQIERICVVANLVDWRPKAECLALSKEGSIIIDIPIWEPERVVQWFTERAKLHLEARKNGPGPCTDEERWLREYYKPYGYKKDGQLSKNAATSETFETEAEALRWADENDKKVVVRRVQGVPLHCMHYCQVSEWCPQYQAQQQSQQPNVNLSRSAYHNQK